MIIFGHHLPWQWNFPVRAALPFLRRNLAVIARDLDLKQLHCFGWFVHLYQREVLVVVMILNMP